MSKRIIAAHRPGTPLPDGIALNAQLDAALVAFWLDQASPEQKQWIADCLKNARKSHSWLACDCQDHNGIRAAKPPILMIRNLDEIYFLVRNSSRPEHADTCPFRISQEERRKREEQQKASHRSTVDQNNAPQLLGDLISDPKVAAPSNTPRGQATQSPHKDQLFDVLNWLIEGAGLNRCGHEPAASKEQWQAMKELAGAFKVLDNLTALDLLIYRNHHLFDNAYQKPFYAIAAKIAKVEPKLEKAAYLLLVAEKLTHYETGSASIETIRWQDGEDGKRKKSTETIPIFCKIRTPAQEGRGAQDPYLVLIKLVESNKRKIRAIDGVAQPIVSPNNLFPVASDQERQTYFKLLEIGGEHVKSGGRFALEKPVRDRNTPLGDCRPDFIVTRDTGGRAANTLIIETIGLDSPEYRTRKASTAPTLRQLANTLIEDDRSGATPDQVADDLLSNQVSNWLAGESASR